MVVLRNPSSAFMGRPEKPLPYGVGLTLSFAATVAFWAALLAPILRNW